MIPGSDDTHELVVVRPGDGRRLRWNTYATQEAADLERIKLAKVGMFAIVRKLTTEIAK